MSTGKIGRTLSPRTKVTPNYGKQEATRKEDTGKLDSALDLLIEELGSATELIKEQNKAINSVFNKLQEVTTKLNALEERTRKSEETVKLQVKACCEQVKKDISDKLDSLLKEQEEVKQNKSWFK